MIDLLNNLNYFYNDDYSFCMDFILFVKGVMAKHDSKSDLRQS